MRWTDVPTKDWETIRNALAKEGTDFWSLIAICDCAELQKTIARCGAYGDDIEDDLMEAMVGIYISLQFLQIMHAIDRQELNDTLTKRMKSMERAYEI